MDRDAEPPLMKESMRSVRSGIGVAIVAALIAGCGRPVPTPETSVAAELWPSYGHDDDGTRYSPLQDVNRGHVSQLRLAWRGHAADPLIGRPFGFETTPIAVDGTLYYTTGINRVISLDPTNGAQRWAFDPHIDLTANYRDGLINRGLATWLDEKMSVNRPCRHRIFEATLDARLIALDAISGKPCTNFGSTGEVSSPIVRGYRAVVYHMTSRPAVADDVVIVGSSINDNVRANSVIAPRMRI